MKLSKPRHTTFSFEGGELEIKLPEKQIAKYSIGDKVKDAMELLKGIFTVDMILDDWGGLLYCMIKKEGKETIMFCTTEEGIAKVES